MHSLKMNPICLKNNVSSKLQPRESYYKNFSLVISQKNISTVILSRYDHFITDKKKIISTKITDKQLK